MNDSIATLVILVPSHPNPTSTSHSLVFSTSTSSLFKTVVGEVHADTQCCKANLLFDEGAKKPFISQKFADILNVQSCEEQNICLSSFRGTVTPTKLQATHDYLQARSGDEISVSALIFP